MIQLICITLLACFIGIFAFTLIFYAFDNYWLEQSITNHSFWWLNNNAINFTGFDYDMISTTEIIDYGDEY
jgi:Na+-transporting NADH:ubiquinone oxidoreductase subunit NqrB